MNEPDGRRPERLAYTINEVAELAGGVSHKHVYNLIHRGVLEVVKFGGRTLITARSLNAALGLTGDRDAPPAA